VMIFQQLKEFYMRFRKGDPGTHSVFFVFLEDNVKVIVPDHFIPTLFADDTNIHSLTDLFRANNLSLNISTKKTMLY